ncbi:MAG: TonB-dependent receptor [Bacteroidaceae bacterium]|nr:TonB-dependent receptor [Bacteroidaceae bacterium]
MNLYPLLALTLAAASPLMAQTTPQQPNAVGTPIQSAVTGVVVDAAGQPLIGAQVRWKDTPSAVATNTDGRFVLPRHAKQTTLAISYIGYKTREITVDATQSELRIQLDDDAQNLDEVVAVGYGVQKKSSLTGSVETIKAEDLLMMPTTNLDQAITGQVAGLQVMQLSGDPSTARESQMRIRGILNSPLLVIDGVPRFGTNTSDGEMRISDLNPDDIESISILKDAAAAAVYGARAANGVILVQTKRAKTNRKLQVNYRGQFNFQQSTQMPKFVDAYQHALLRNQAVDNTPGTTVEKYTDEQLEQIRLGTAPNVFGNENLIDRLDATGSSTTHSISANGGNEHTSYYLSVGYADSRGLYTGIGRQRLNYMAKLDAQLHRRLQLSVQLSGTRNSSNNSSYNTLGSIYAYSPLQVMQFTDGRLASISGGNPLINIQGLGGSIANKGKMGTITTTLTWDVPWVEGLSAYVRGTFDDNNNVQSTFSRPVTLYTYDAKTNQTAEDPNTVYPNAKVTYAQNDTFFESQLYEAGLNYNRTFAQHHVWEGTLVANYQRTHNKYMTGTNLDKSIFPETMGTAQKAQLVGNEYRNQRASLIGRAKYGYAHRYFGEFSFRLDGSNNFRPERRWGFFPSLAAAWVVSNEPFFAEWDQRVLTNAKVRLSTGWLGNDGQVESYSYLKNYMEAPGLGYPIGGNYVPGLRLTPGGYPNPDLTWGKTHDWNFATDLGFWDGKIGLSFEYFVRYETDKITSAPSYLFPPSTGVEGNVPNINFAELKAWGWDLTINHRNTVGKLRYNVGLTLSRTDDRYLDYGDESAQLPNLRRAGKASMVWTMYEADGLFRSQEELDAHPIDQDGQGNATLAPGDIRYVDQNGDKIIDANDRVMIKNSSYPDMDLALKFGINYKGWFVNALVQGVVGYKQNITEYYALDNSTLPKFQAYHLTDTWAPERPDAQYPRIKFATTADNNRRASTFWVRDCDFVRLKMLNVGYTFPARWLRRLGVASASIALQASNLFTLTNLDLGMDPESLRGYPVQRSYGLTLNVGF